MTFVNIHMMKSDDHLQTFTVCGAENKHGQWWEKYSGAVKVL